MLSLVTESRTREGRIHRRQFLRLAGGLTGAACWPQTGRSADGVRRAKSVIVVFASGGQSHLDMWDPKPLAPPETRGEFNSIQTAVPGTILCEHLPRLARLADRYTLLRTMSHADLDHGSAVYLSLTGRYHVRPSSNPPAQPIDAPAWMSIYKRVRPGSGTIDDAIAVNAPAIVAPNTIAPGQFGGFLGREYDPLFVGNVHEVEDPVPGLEPWPDLSVVRMRERESLLAAVNRTTRELEGVASVADLRGRYRKALDLLQNPRTREAFNLSAEPAALRDRYGRNRSGQACLLARRLVEAGVPLITVIWNHHSRGQDTEPDNSEAYGWDTHNDIFEALRDRLLPRFDLSFSALLEDLEQRGLLDETLVVCLGEFGRAPLVALEPRFAGSTPGRKHWSSAYSIVLAGAGVSRGQVIGKTDRQGAYPATESYGPWDVAATIFAALGVDPDSVFHDRIDRPIPVSLGRPIAAAYQG